MRERFYLSTIDPQAQDLARAHGLGLELAEFCTAWNLEEQFAETDAAVKKKLEGIPRRVLHGPFNELFPCAIDPRARQLAQLRFRQALEMAKRYGASKVVFHGGYNPWLYFPVWYREQSILFWQAFAAEIPEGITVCLENVMEETPQMLLEIVQAVDHPQLGLCLDVGHVNAYSRIPAMQWVADSAPYIRHFHIHNNQADADTHQNLQDGTIPMAQLLAQAQDLCPQATYTLEIPDGAPSVAWLEQYLF